jgi:hypothetical protein
MPMGSSGRVLSWMSSSVNPAKPPLAEWQLRQSPRPLNTVSSWHRLQTPGTSGMFGCGEVAWQVVHVRIP